MSKVKNRALAILMAICMSITLLSVIPISASADSQTDDETYSFGAFLKRWGNTGDPDANGVVGNNKVNGAYYVGVYDFTNVVSIVISASTNNNSAIVLNAYAIDPTLDLSSINDSLCTTANLIGTVPITNSGSGWSNFADSTMSLTKNIVGPKGLIFKIVAGGTSWCGNYKSFTLQRLNMDKVAGDAALDEVDLLKNNPDITMTDSMTNSLIVDMDKISRLTLKTDTTQQRVVVTWQSSDSSVVQNNGTFGTFSDAKEVTLTALASVVDSTITRSKTYKLLVIPSGLSDQDRADKDAENIQNLLSSYTSSPMTTIPVLRTEGIYGSKIKYTSSDSKFLDIDDAGIVTIRQPAFNNKIITVTAAVSKGEHISATVPQAQITVQAAGGRAIVNAMQIPAIKKDYLYISLPSLDSYGYTLSIINSSLPGVITTAGNVIPPEQDTTVTLTIMAMDTLGDSMTKDIQVTVPAGTPGRVDAESISISPLNGTTMNTMSDGINLVVNFHPSNTTNRDIKWTIQSLDGTQATKASLTDTGNGTCTVKPIDYGSAQYKVTALVLANNLNMTAEIILNSKLPELTFLNKNATLFAGQPGNASKAFDGDLTTFYDEGRGYCGIDLGEGNAMMLKKARVHMRDDNNGYWVRRFPGARLQGSNDMSTWTTLYTATTAPPPFTWVEILESQLAYSTTSFRYFRYYQPNDYCSVAEVEFYGINGVIGVANAMTSIPAPQKDQEVLVLPVPVRRNHTVKIKSSTNPDVITTDGRIIPPAVDTTVGLVLTVSDQFNNTADTGTINVTVPSGSANKVKVDSININISGGSEDILNVGDQRQISVSVAPSNASFSDAVYSVCNLDGTPTKIASVDSSGLLTAKSGGVYKITAKALGGWGVVEEKIIRNIFPQIQAEDYGSISGSVTDDLTTDIYDSSGYILTGIKEGDYVVYKGVSLDGIDGIDLRVRSKNPATIEIREDDINGTLLGKADIDSTDGYDPVTKTTGTQWDTKHVTLTTTGRGGPKNICILFKTDGVELNWLRLTGFQSSLKFNGKCIDARTKPLDLQAGTYTGEVVIDKAWHNSINECALVMALYDGDKMVKCKYVPYNKDTTPAVGDKYILSGDLDVESPGSNYSIEMYLWDNIMGRHPLAKPLISSESN